MGATGCFAPDTASFTLTVPEAKSSAELNLIRSTLLAEQELLPDGKTFYHSIEITMDPGPGLVVRYDPRNLRTQNIIYKVNKLGYGVGNRPGNPETRLTFLRETARP